jgi:pyruvate dehydrogenase E2 component (dihydrolipoamide acetyltransferase)
MSIEILMPALSPTMEEGTLAKWHVKAGDTVKAGDVIAEIETDKATMEVEAVDEGVVEALLVDAGTENVKVNAVIARLAGEGSSLETPAAPAPRDDDSKKARQPEEAAPAAVSKAAAPPVQAAGETGATTKAPVPKLNGSTGERVFASPLARRLAQAAGIDLKSIAGSGPHGRVIKADVDAARGKAPASAPASTGAALPPPRRPARSSRSNSRASPPAATTSSRSTACARPSPGG